jgi:hypothetical protein
MNRLDQGASLLRLLTAGRTGWPLVAMVAFATVLATPPTCPAEDGAPYGRR